MNNITVFILTIFILSICTSCSGAVTNSVETTDAATLENITTVTEQITETTPTTNSLGNLTWAFDSETGVLTISGACPMTNYTDIDTDTSAPWTTYRSSIKTIYINDCVTSIGSYAFSYCNSLTSITIPDSVTSIDITAFSHCNNLTNIFVSPSNNYYMTDEDGVLFNKDKSVLIQYPIGNSLIDYTIPDSVTTIGSSAFAYCYNLKLITIPDSITNIGDNAFLKCSSLRNVIIPDSTTSIGSSAFSYCSNLTSINIPASVTNISSSAFYNCYSLIKFIVTLSNEFYLSDEYGVLFNKDKDILIQYPIGNLQIEYTIPNKVTSIGDSAFYGCSSLTNVTIPDSVMNIGSEAFSDCDSLTSIIVSSSNNFYISDEYGVLFNKDKDILIQYPTGKLLTEYTIPDSVTSICDSAFIGCRTLSNITIPDSVARIGSEAFRGCNNLTSVTIPDSVTSIGSEAFSGCHIITNITLPDSVTSIGNGIFSYCYGLTSVNISNSIMSISVGMFLCCSELTIVTIPESLTKIDSSAFFGCYSLRNVTIPDSVTIIGSKAFYECYSFTNVNIPDSVTTIGNNAFSYCTGLTSVTIPDSVTNIGFGVFSNCYRLASVTISDNITSIEASTFSCCENLTSIAIPDSVTSIGSSAFSECRSLKSVIIPDQVTNIGCEAFYFCINLTSVNISDSVKSIGNGAFLHCGFLKSVNIPNSVMNIGSEAFSGCDGLTINISSSNKYYLVDEDGVLFNKDKSILIQYPINNSLIEYTIPDSVTSIESSAFFGCRSLTNIIIPDSITSIGRKAFKECYHLTSVTIPDSVTSIGDNAFSECTGLTNFVVSSSNTYYYADEDGVLFNKEKNILIQYPTGNSRTEYTIPDSITHIGTSAFYLCYNLTSITISDSVRSIDAYAFSSCNNLTSVLFKGDIPETFNDGNFDFTSENFIIYYIEGKSGWTTPTWKAPNGSTYFTANKAPETNQEFAVDEVPETKQEFAIDTIENNNVETAEETTTPPPEIDWTGIIDRYPNKEKVMESVNLSYTNYVTKESVQQIRDLISNLSPKIRDLIKSVYLADEYIEYTDAHPYAYSSGDGGGGIFIVDANNLEKIDDYLYHEIGHQIYEIYSIENVWESSGTHDIQEEDFCISYSAYMRGKEDNAITAILAKIEDP